MNNALDSHTHTAGTASKTKSLSNIGALSALVQS
jgi:hypothetical protein